MINRGLHFLRGAFRMRASLVPLDGGQAIEIVKEIVVIGRTESCDIQIDDPSVSKVHLLIAQTDGLLVFRDMGSTNGTKVNGQRVIRGMLLPNDKLQIAACRYQVQMLPDGPVQGSAEPEPDGRHAEVGVRVFKAEDLAQRSEGLMEQAAPAVAAPVADALIDVQPSSKTPVKSEEAVHQQAID